MQPTCWVLFDKGKTGTLNQCLGLAECMGLNITIIPLTARLPWRWLPPVLWPFSLKCIHQSATLSPPWPDIIIAGGRVSAIPAATIKLLSQGRTKVIQLLNPRIDPRHFDAVIVPQHDTLNGDNVLHTLGTFHRVTAQRLVESAQVFAIQFADLPRPCLTVLIGGSNRIYRMNRQVIDNLVQQLCQLSRKNHYSLLISISRRTAPALTAYLRQQLQGLPVHFWDGIMPNPYYAYLNLADKIIVTGDSISMITEAASTGKPVYIYRLPGYSKKFERFYRAMERGNHSRFYSYPLKFYTPQVLNDYTAIAPQLSELINKSLKQ